MNKEQLDKQLNTGEYLIWAVNRIEELENVLNTIYEINTGGVQDLYIGDLIENVLNYEFRRLSDDCIRRKDG